MKRVLLFVLAFVLGMGTFAVIKNVGDDSGPDDTEIIEAVRRTEEVSLVSLAIQGIKTERKTNSKIFFGIDIPLTSKTLFLKYSFAAKLGRFWTKIRSALPLRHSARTRTSPPGASSVRRVSGSALHSARSTVMPSRSISSMRRVIGSSGRSS